MNKRKASDSDVQRVARHFHQEPMIREATKAWGAEDFVYGLERVEIDTPGVMRDQLRSLFRKLRDERETAGIRAEADAASERRHSELTRRIEELKKPHWSVAPNFWMTLAILILTAIGATAAVMALFR